jgi:hypothetical protein
MPVPKKFNQRVESVKKAMQDAFASIAPLQGWDPYTDKIGFEAVKLLRTALILVERAAVLAAKPGADPKEVQGALQGAYKVTMEFADAYIGLPTAVVNMRATKKDWAVGGDEQQLRLIDAVTEFGEVLDHTRSLAEYPFDAKYWA